MRRREFVAGIAATIAASSRWVLADHHFVSARPLVVEFDLASLTGRYTPTSDFYIRNHFDEPPVPASPAILIDGEVERPLRLEADSIGRLPRHRVASVLECAGDPVQAVSLVSDGVWSGPRLRDLLSLARPKPQARFAHFYGYDGFARSVPIERLMNGGLLATTLNGAPLDRHHGAPWRALFPGWYGMDSVKWLGRITLARDPLRNEGGAYLETWRNSSGTIIRRSLPPVQVKSVITSPADGSVLHAGPIVVKGLAWSGGAKISVVQAGVQAGIDRGAHWKTAELDQGPSRFDWVLWSATFVVRAGTVEIVSRATDLTSHSQPPRRDPRRLDSYAYNIWDRIRCVVV